LGVEVLLGATCSEESEMNSTKTVMVEKAKAGYPAIFLRSSEYTRCFKEIEAMAEEVKREYFVWTLTKGFKIANNKYIEDTGSPGEALEYLMNLKNSKSILAVLPLMHHFLDDPGIQARLIELIPIFKMTGRMLIIVSPVLKLPMEVEKEFAVVDMTLPDKDELDHVLTSIVKAVSGKNDMTPSDTDRRHLIEAAQGLTTTEAENAFSLCVIRSKKAGNQKWDSTFVMEEKCATLKKTGLLTYYPPGKAGLSQIGGMANLKTWISIRKDAFTDEATKYGLDPLKGILMVGPPGSGKSIGARAISEELELPLLRCDMGRIFAGLVGASEENARRVIETAEAVSPCVLWLDEIEKGFAGSGGGSLDSGVGARVLGTFLTWMQEKKSSVFVYATANNVSALPPELLRKGRFDETFSVLLPNHTERQEIFQIHLNKRKRGDVLKKGDLELLAAETDSFSGAEIEAIVNEALFTSFSNKRRQLAIHDLTSAIKATVPLSKMMKREIEAMQEWCKNRTRPANAGTVHETQTSGRAIEA